jgi:hypothetical protein
MDKIDKALYFCYIIGMKEEIEKKRAYIKWYREHILGNYQGRWYNSGLTYIEGHEAELKVMEEAYKKELADSSNSQS